jgi:hypothetical protein
MPEKMTSSYFFFAGALAYLLAPLWRETLVGADILGRIMLQ